MKRYNRNKDKQESRKSGREFSDGFDVDFFVFKSISTRLLPTLWETTESIESRRMVSVRKSNRFAKLTSKTD